jgi:hypothetical protein
MIHNLYGRGVWGQNVPTEGCGLSVSTEGCGFVPTL